MLPLFVPLSVVVSVSVAVTVAVTEAEVAEAAEVAAAAAAVESEAERGGGRGRGSTGCAPLYTRSALSNDSQYLTSNRSKRVAQYLITKGVNRVICVSGVMSLSCLPW